MQKEKENSCENVMVNEDVLAKSKSVSIASVRFIALLLAAIFAPVLNIQAATGTLVNATLFIAASMFGAGGAILIGIVPSLISAMTGLLPAAILPIVPFIIASNAILVLVFLALKNKSYWKGVVSAAVLKFAFLSVVSTYIIHFFVSEKVSAQIALMMSWPQLFTALSGGILAYFVLRVAKKLK